VARVATKGHRCAGSQPSSTQLKNQMNAGCTRKTPNDRVEAAATRRSPADPAGVRRDHHEPSRYRPSATAPNNGTISGPSTLVACHGGTPRSISVKYQASENANVARTVVTTRPRCSSIQAWNASKWYAARHPATR